MSFEKYTDCILNALQFHPRPNDVLSKKKVILDSVSEFHNMVPSSVLYVGFNPAILIDNTKSIFITEVSTQTLDYLKQNKIKFEYIDPKDLESQSKRFDVVIALDEYFTFAKNEQEQRNLVTKICNLAKEYIITTCKDYKNQEFKDREFSSPALLRGSQNTIYLEFHDHSNEDRNAWHTNLYQIHNNEFEFHGPFLRRSMFFKQLAKFSTDAGSTGFTIHKNIMYKSLLKKNYEHVISIRFD